MMFLGLGGEEMLLHAPFTPFFNDTLRSLNTAPIPEMAETAHGFGVNVIWTVGGMGQFETLTIDERREVNAAWVKAGHAHGMYVIAHVGTTVLSDAIALAEHAVTIGADAIAAVPPYYTIPESCPSVIDSLVPISAAAPDLPFYYYHIPSVTGVEVSIDELLNEAAEALPMLVLGGVKFVAPDNGDWFQSVMHHNETTRLLFAPEPKVQALAMPGSGVVLAEDFFAPSYLRMRDAFRSGDDAKCLAEQEWKLQVAAVFSSYGGASAERTVYRRLCANGGCDLGPPRLPLQPMPEEDYEALCDALDALGFWEQ